MKKLVLFFTVISLLVFPFTAAAVQPEQEPALSGFVYSFVPGTVPAQTDLSQSMAPAIHALVLTMVENDLAYDGESDLFFWTGMYYMLSLYGQRDDRARLTDDMLILPSETVRDYAAALFPHRQELPELPGALQDRITYRADDDTYSLARGDEGLAEIRLASSQPRGDGVREIAGELIYLEDESPLASFRVELVPQGGMLGYAISDLVLFG